MSRSRVRVPQDAPTYPSIPVAQWIEQWISNPLVRGSSPFGDTIYGISSMDRVPAYEAVDVGSTPTFRTIFIK